MSVNSKNAEQNSPPYSPKTEEEKEEAFRLSDELERELARHGSIKRVAPVGSEGSIVIELVHQYLDRI